MRAAAALVAVAAIALAACGGDGSGTADDGSGSRLTAATLVLDFVPGPVHAGIYDAVANGYYADAGIDLEIIEPTSTADTLKLIDAGKADFGLADGIDVAGQIAQGRSAKGILALVQRPLGGLIALRRSGFGSPADLEGRTVGHHRRSLRRRGSGHDGRRCRWRSRDREDGDDRLQRRPGPRGGQDRRLHRLRARPTASRSRSTAIRRPRSTSMPTGGRDTLASSPSRPWTRSAPSRT